MDHAWTFRPNLAREQLARIPGLAERMAALMDIEAGEDSDDKEVREKVLVQMWRFANTYWVGNAEWAEDRQGLPDVQTILSNQTSKAQRV